MRIMTVILVLRYNVGMRAGWAEDVGAVLGWTPALLPRDAAERKSARGGAHGRAGHRREHVRLDGAIQSTGLVPPRVPLAHPI